MNKHNCLLDMIVDKILFVPGRCNHNSDNTSSFKELTFIPSVLPPLVSPPIIPKRPSSATVEEETIDDTTPLLENDIDILEVEAAAYYKLTRDKNNKLFSLTIAGTDKAYLTSVPSRGPRVPVNKPCPCGSGIKYKKCCGSNTPVNSGASHPVRINSAETLTRDEILAKLSIEYYDYADVFDRTKADKLSPHRSYNYKLEFIDDHDKIGLSKSRIYSISGHKLEQVKKYLDEHLKKGFIVLSHASFASSILFAKKPNGELRFYINYRKLNAITKRNRYSIPLIDEVLARIQNYKYLTRLNIIAAFNKLRIYQSSEDFTTFVTSLEAYKYKVLSFGLTNGSATYQQYINDILFKYLNDFCQAYLNNILIYSKLRKEHVTHVRKIL